MKFFVDTADIVAIKELVALNLVDGVTTNPTLVAKSGGKFLDTIAEICRHVTGSVSAEVAASDYQTMMQEAEVLAKIAPQVTIKLPLTLAGLQACHALTTDGIKVNITLCFSVNQALLAAKAGATYISPFIGRLDDVGHDGLQLVEQIIQVYDNYGYQTQVLAASIRHHEHIRQAALLGADVITAPPKVLKTLVNHPLTENGLKQFNQDWLNSGQKILP
jgi:transaldolase